MLASKQLKPGELMVRFFRILSLAISAMVFPSLFSLPLVHSAPERSTPSPTPHPSEAVATPTPAPDTFIDREHAALSRFVTETVYKFDNFFGEDYLEEEIRKPWVRVRGSVEWKEGWEFVFKQHFHANIPLPVLERRLHAFFGSDADDDLEHDPDYIDPEEDTDFAAGLRYYLKDIKNISTSFNSGIKLKKKPVVYVKPRVKWSYPLPPYCLEVVQYVFWYSDDGFGETTDFYVNRLLGKRWLVRSVSEATYSETSEGMDLSQEFDLRYLDFSLRHSDQFAASLEWETDAHTWELFQADKHQLRLRLRHSIWRDWLRLEISPRLTWERQHPDEGKSYWKKAFPSLLLTLEILFEEEGQAGGK